MIIKTYNENHEYLVFIDIEFNNRELVQFAGLLFKRIEDETYQLMRSCNQYVTTRVCYPFMEYTSITNSFLEANGVSLKDVQTIVFDDFLADIDLKDVMVISHGLKNDRLVAQLSDSNKRQLIIDVANTIKGFQLMDIVLLTTLNIFLEGIII